MALVIDMQMGLFLLDGIVRATAGPAQICQRSESEEPGSYGGHRGVGWGGESRGDLRGKSPFTVSKGRYVQKQTNHY